MSQIQIEEYLKCIATNTSGSNSDFPTASATADGETTAVSRIGSYGFGFDGTNWDQLRTIKASDLNAGSGVLAVGNTAERRDGTSPIQGTASGDIIKLVADSRGGLNVNITNGDGGRISVRDLSVADAYTASVQALNIASHGLRYNGTTFERERSNTDITALASASRTVDTTSSDLTNHNARGVILVLDTTIIGTGSVTLTVEGKDALSGKYYTIFTGAAVITNTTSVYKIYPGITVAANLAVSDILPRTWRVKMIANNANPATYSVGASLIL